MGSLRGPWSPFVFALVIGGCEPDAASPPSDAGGAANEVTRALGSLEVALPASASRPLVIRARGLSIDVTLAGARGGPVADVDGGRTYADALGAGADWQLHLTERAVEDALSLPVAPPEDRVRYRIGLGDGVAGLRVAGGVVELLDEAGTPALRVSRAAVIDAAGKRHAVALDVEGCAVDRSTPPPWRRRVVPPGATACDIVARLPHGLAYPATFDPLWSTADDMVVPRYDFQTATLGDGTILAVGGAAFGLPVEVEAFDPTTLTWSLLGSSGWLPAGAEDFALTALDDGRVLLTGGEWDQNGTHTVKSVLAFDPSTTSWVALPDMATERKGHTATSMTDGRVVVVGGEFQSSRLAVTEIFDPTTNTWSPTAPMPEGHAYHRALAVGAKVLVVSGISETASNDNRSFLFDPAGAGSWSTPATTATGRWGHVVTPLGADKVLMAGGYQNGSFGFATVVEVYDIATDQWSIPQCGGVDCVLPPMVEARAVPGPLGGVVMTGGCGEASPYCAASVETARWFDPSDGTPHPAGDLVVGRGKHAMVGLPDGRLVVMGGQGGLDGSLILGDTRVFSVEPAGQACVEDFECATAHCVDGLCCDTACDSTCEACASALTGSPDGTCAPIAPNTDPEDECLDSGAPSCGGSGVCADGACASYAGPGCSSGACDEPADCASGSCVDGVCCDASCGGTCSACTAAKKGEGVDGLCGLVVRGADPDDECDDGGAVDCEEQRVCDGLGVCRTGAEACGFDACVPGGCTSGCDGDDDCGASGACVLDVCVDRTTLCTNDSIALARDGTQSDCAPYRCTQDGACLTACSSVDDCAGGTVCDEVEDRCIPVPASSGGDEGCACASAPSGPSAPRGAMLALACAVLASRRRRRP